MPEMDEREWHGLAAARADLARQVAELKSRNARLRAALEATLEANGHTATCNEIRQGLSDTDTHGCHRDCELVRAALAEVKGS